MKTADANMWKGANRQLDAVARALFEGRYLDALRLGRVAAAKLRDAAGPEHPAYAQLDQLAS